MSHFNARRVTYNRFSIHRISTSRSKPGGIYFRPLIASEIYVNKYYKRIYKGAAYIYIVAILWQFVP